MHACTHDIVFVISFFKWTFTLVIMGTFNPFTTNRIELTSQIDIYEHDCTHVTSASSDLVMKYMKVLACNVSPRNVVVLSSSRSIN